MFSDVYEYCKGGENESRNEQSSRPLQVVSRFGLDDAATGQYKEHGGADSEEASVDGVGENKNDKWDFDKRGEQEERKVFQAVGGSREICFKMDGGV